MPVSSQSTLPLKLPEALKQSHRGLICSDFYAFARKNKGAIIKDFHCAIPKKFPENGKYSRSRNYLNERGEEFVKEYTLKGNFKEYDEDYRIFLTDFWKIVDGKNISFCFDEKDFLEFKGIDSNQQKNVLLFRDYLKRTEVNRWQLNFWRDHKRKTFRKGGKSYGIIQSIGYLEGETPEGVETSFKEVTWTQDYFDALIHGENWKYFDLGVYASLAEEQQLAKKLLRFFGEGNNEFIIQEIEENNYIVIRFKIEIELLCTFYLAQPEQSIWKYKDTLKKPLRTLQEKGKLRFNNVNECFSKEDRKTHLEVDYIYRNKSKISPTQTSILDNSPNAEPEKHLQSGLLQELQSHGVIEKQAQEIVTQYTEQRIQNAIEILSQKKKNKEKIGNEGGLLVSAIKEGWTVQNFDPDAQRRKKEQEKMRKTNLEEKAIDIKKKKVCEEYRRMDDKQKFLKIHDEFLTQNKIYARFSPQKKQEVNQKILKDVLPKSNSIGVAQASSDFLVRSMARED